jgi:hypothetical protein
MYLNVYDPKHAFIGVHHFSFEAQNQKGLFNAVYKWGDKAETYSHRGEIPGDIAAVNELSNGRLTVKVVEPQKRFRVQFNGETFKTALEYEGRFPVFDYKDCPPSGESPLLELGRRALPYEHQEQGLLVRGTAEVDGRQLTIDGLANRDHSWGLRNEFVFEWHYWTGIHFPDRFINFCAIRDKTTEPPIKHGGFMSRREGNTAIRRIVVREEPQGVEIPERIRYELEDVKGGRHHLVFDAKGAVGPIYFPNIPVEETLVYEMMDLFGAWTEETTGEKAQGLNEIGRLKDTASGKYRYSR